MTMAESCVEDLLAAVRGARSIDDVWDGLADVLGALPGSGPVRRWQLGGAGGVVSTTDLPKVAARALVEGPVVDGDLLAVAVPADQGPRMVLVADAIAPDQVPLRTVGMLAGIAGLAAARLAEQHHRDQQAVEVAALHQVLENVAAATTPRAVAAAVLTVVVNAYGWDGGVVVRRGAPTAAELLDQPDVPDEPLLLATAGVDPAAAAVLQDIGDGGQGLRGQVVGEALPGGHEHALVWPLYDPADVRLVVHGAHPMGIDEGLGAVLGPIAQVASAARAGLDRLDQAARQRRAAEAERANAAKSEFLSRMSHELRTPLNAVLGFAQLLELEDLEDDALDSLKQIRRAGAHLLDLVNEVLDIARIEAGRITLSVEPIEIDQVIVDCASLVAPIAASRQVTVAVDRAGTAGRVVRADLQRTKQVLINLLTNACNYNHPGGRVDVSAADEGGRLVIDVADTGLGIPAGRMAEVFVPFERLGREGGPVEGTGLGLALSRRLAEAMGGTLTATSTQGEGSTFSLSLPLATLQPSLPVGGAGEDGAALDRRVADRTGTVLYIEDNRSNLTLVRHLLKRRPGVMLLHSVQGSVGIQLARAHHPDLVLLDLDLPDLDGQDVMAALRADPATADIPVVVVSADATPHRIRALRDAGALDYLTKPFDIGRLLDAVDQVLSAAPVTAPAAPPAPADPPPPNPPPEATDAP